MELLIVIAGYIVAINIVCFAAFGIDKLKARRGSYRISERRLLGLAAAGGAFGGYAAMKLFRHKTQHRKFTVTVPLLMLLYTAVFAVIAYLLLRLA